MNEFEFNLEVNEGLVGKALTKLTPEGDVKYTFYVSRQQMDEIAWHSQHVHEEHPEWAPNQVLAMAMKIVLLQSEKNANKINENGAN